MKSTREYRMTVRADTVAATRERLLRAVIEIGLQELDLDPQLSAVADRAGVSVQTALRHFGSRAALLSAAGELARAEIGDQRRPTDGRALRALVAHYDELGDFVLAMLARERVDPAAADMTARGKRLHRDWVAEVFASRLPDEGREELIDLLVVATDVYAWKLLRRDRGLDAAAVEARMRTMTDALLPRPEGSP